MRTISHASYALFAWLLFIALSIAYPYAGMTQPLPQTYETTAEAQVRRGPGTNHEVIAIVPAGIKIHVVGREGEWLKIESKQGNRPGYIHSRDARPWETTQSTKPTPVPVKGIYVTTADVDLRSGAGLNYTVLRKIPKGIKVHVIAAEGEWLRIESKHGTEPGYIESRFATRLTR